MKESPVTRIISSIFFSVSLLIVALHFALHPVRVLGMSTSIFYMDEKYTLASFFTVITAFLTGFLYLSSVHKKRDRTSKILNGGVGVFFVMLSLDEFFEIHEYVNTIVKSSLSSRHIIGDLGTVSWIFPLSAIIVAVLALLILKIIREKNELAQRSMIFGVTAFVFVLVFELFGSVTYGTDIYVTSVAIEEGLEMAGVCFFLRAVLLEQNNA